jgi:hypothetical protein
MQQETFACGNGLVVDYVDMGVEYTYNGRTLQIVGDYAEGELSMSDSDEVFGYYTREDGDDVTVVQLRDGRVFTVGDDEADYERLALMLLS